jgi:hypothetical protein
MFQLNLQHHNDPACRSSVYQQRYVILKYFSVLCSIFKSFHLQKPYYILYIGNIFIELIFCWEYLFAFIYSYSGKLQRLTHMKKLTGKILKALALILFLLLLCMYCSFSECYFLCGLQLHFQINLQSSLFLFQFENVNKNL